VVSVIEFDAVILDQLSVSIAHEKFASENESEIDVVI
jgi:hypothetical protein